MPLLNLRLARPGILIDLNRIDGMSYIRKESSQFLIGAMTRQREVEFSEPLARELPILVEAVTQIGHPAIRNRGTIGGSLAHADPAAELPCVMAALDGEIICVGPGGERAIAASRFFTGLLSTALAEDEIIRELRVPLPRQPAGWGFIEFSRRYGDFALADVAVVLFSSDSGRRCDKARVVLGGAGTVVSSLATVEELIGEEAAPDLEDASRMALFKEAERRAREETREIFGNDESAAYRRQLASVLTRRCVESAMDRWKVKWKTGSS